MRMFVKNAIAALALIGGLFASCSQEDLTTIYTPDPATVTFNVAVINSLTGEDVTAKATITGAEPMSEAAGINSEVKRTISASLGDAKGSAEVTVAPLKKGGKATYNVNVILVGDEWNLIAKTVTKMDSVNVIKNLNHGAVPYSHDGGTWFENATAYFMPITITYGLKNVATVENYTVDPKYLSDSEIKSWELVFEKAFADVQKNAVTIQYADHTTAGKPGTVLSQDGIVVGGETITHDGVIIYHDGKVVDAKTQTPLVISHDQAGNEVNARVYTYTASAWSLSRPVITYTTTTTQYDLTSKAQGAVAATFVVQQKYSAIKCNYEEIAHPSHAAHYIQYHGHGADGHGGSNAGGGIVLPD